MAAFSTELLDSKDLKPAAALIAQASGLRAGVEGGDMADIERILSLAEE
jgi:hypothetical protein